MLLSLIKTKYPTVFLAFELFWIDNRKGKERKTIDEEVQIEEDRIADAEKLLSSLKEDELPHVCLNSDPSIPFTIFKLHNFKNIEVKFLFAFLREVVLTDKGIFHYPVEEVKQVSNS